jgi:hypothetical protein
MALTLPLGASATTGIETSVPVRVVLTTNGAVWTPAVSKLHPDTDTTFEIKVINKTAEAHSFKIGYRETKVLARGASQFFYFSFHLVGPTVWQARHGKVQGSAFHGKFNVTVQHPFTSNG